MLEEPERAREDFRAQSAVTLAQRGSPDWWLEKWGYRAGQDAAHSRECAGYLAACHRDVLCADDSGSFDDEGSWEDGLAFYKPWGFDLTAIQAPVCLWHGHAGLPPRRPCPLASRPYPGRHYPVSCRRRPHQHRGKQPCSGLYMADRAQIDPRLAGAALEPPARPGTSARPRSAASGHDQILVKWWKHSQAVSCAANAAASARLTAR